MKKIIVVLLSLMLIISFVACSEDDASTASTLIPGSDGLIIANYINSTNLELTWTKATDDITSQTNLQYLVYYSANANITTVAEMELNGVPLGNYSNNINLKVISGLANQSFSYFNIAVKDEDLNKAAYIMKKVSSYDPSPVFGNSGLIDVLIMSTNSVAINWVKAVDNVTPQFALQYLVYYSTNINMNSVADIEANGYPVGVYEYDITTKVVSSVKQGTLYYFNIIVKDEDGNKSVYVKKEVNINSINYYGNGNTSGIVPIDSNYYSSGQEVTVLGNSGNLLKINVNNDSYCFVGWTNSSGVTYTNGDTFIMSSENVTLFAKWVSYVARDVGPAGGWVFYDKGNYSDGWRYLEAAPPWSETWNLWGDNFTNTYATNTVIGSGQQNSIDIISVDVFSNKAADFCANLKITNNGITYEDWFLPSYAEINKIYFNLHNGTNENNDVYTPVGDFSGEYWSSSESGIGSAWVQSFNDGNQFPANKENFNETRAIRSF